MFSAWVSTDLILSRLDQGRRRGRSRHLGCVAARPAMWKLDTRCGPRHRRTCDVCPPMCSRAFRSARRDAMRRTASTDPVRGAVIGTVSPGGSAPCASSSAAGKIATIGSPRLRQASQSGVAPKSFAVATFAPARTRVSGIASWFQWAAQCRAFAPCACRVSAETHLLKHDGHARRVGRPGCVD